MSKTHVLNLEQRVELSENALPHIAKDLLLYVRIAGREETYDRMLD